MGFIGDLFGGSKGAGFQAQQVPIRNPITDDQIAYGVNQQQNFINALQGQNGIGNQGAVFNQLQGVADGTGPNPAQAMLSQATGRNVANQAALMASQRGTSANPGLIARQAAMQGANLQQQAAGQGASMQAQQSLGALGQMGDIANNQVNTLGGSLQGYNSNAFGALSNFNNANVAQATGMNSANSGVAQQNAKGQQGIIGGVASGIGSFLGLAHGGQVPGSPRSMAGQHFAARNMSSGGRVPGAAAVPGDSLKNDKVPAMLSPKEIVLPRSVTLSPDAPEKAKAFVAAILARNGGK